MNQYGFILPVVTQTSEENAASQQRNLKGLEFKMHMVFMPGVGSDYIRGKTSKETVEEEEKPHRTKDIISKYQGFQEVFRRTVHWLLEPLRGIPFSHGVRIRKLQEEYHKCVPAKPIVRQHRTSRRCHVTSRLADDFADPSLRPGTVRSYELASCRLQDYCSV